MFDLCNTSWDSYASPNVFPTLNSFGAEFRTSSDLLLVSSQHGETKPVIISTPPCTCNFRHIPVPMKVVREKLCELEIPHKFVSSARGSPKVGVFSRSFGDTYHLPSVFVSATASSYTLRDHCVFECL